jgi:hypothetical protein
LQLTRRTREASGGHNDRQFFVVAAAHFLHLLAIRRARYARWAVLLEEEIQLIAKPGAHIVAIGWDVYRFLERNGFDRDVMRIMHYSPQASSARNSAVMGQEVEFGAFAERLTMQDIVDVAAEIMQENSISAAMSSETIARLGKATLSESRKKLAFSYKTEFTKLRLPNTPMQRTPGAALAGAADSQVRYAH